MVVGALEGGVFAGHSLGRANDGSERRHDILTVGCAVSLGRRQERPPAPSCHLTVIAAVRAARDSALTAAARRAGQPSIASACFHAIVSQLKSFEGWNFDGQRSNGGFQAGGFPIDFAGSGSLGGSEA